MKTFKKSDLKETYTSNGFTYVPMFASVAFSSNGEDILTMYDNETEKVNSDDEVCIVETVYIDSRVYSHNIIERDIEVID